MWPFCQRRAQPPYDDAMASDAQDVVDWRREVFDMYRAVRAQPDPALAHAGWVEHRDRLLTSHPASPVAPEQRAAYPGASVAPYDPAFRFLVPMDDAPAERREVATATDGTIPLERIGRLTLPGLGLLDVWWLASYGGGIFVPLRDATSGSTTYGGGRYLIDTVKGADLGEDDGRLILDLNFAYQASCAYDSQWVCPLPGKGNTLGEPVPVGEQYRPVGR